MDHIRYRYGVERKDAEELQKKAGKMAGAMAAFCERMGHRDLALLISRFQVSCHLSCHLRKWVLPHMCLEIWLKTCVRREGTGCYNLHGDPRNITC